MEPLRLPGTRPRELLTVAVTGGGPTASSTGRVTSVPEPTTGLMAPAAVPAAATAIISSRVIGSSQESVPRPQTTGPSGRARRSVRGAFLPAPVSGGRPRDSGGHTTAGTPPPGAGACPPSS